MTQPTFEATNNPARRPAQTIWDAPIWDREAGKPYRKRWIKIGAVTLTAALAVGGAKEAVGVVDQGVTDAAHAVDASIAANDGKLPKPDLSQLPKVYIDKPGNTVWSIASAEGQAVANNPEALYQAENSIDAQLPGNSANNLQPGDPVRLPATSAIGTLDPVPVAHK